MLLLTALHHKVICFHRTCASTLHLTTPILIWRWCRFASPTPFLSDCWAMRPRWCGLGVCLAPLNQWRPQGWIDVTYLSPDGSFRISRGNKVGVVYWSIHSCRRCHLPPSPPTTITQPITGHHFRAHKRPATPSAPFRSHRARRRRQRGDSSGGGPAAGAR